MSISKELFVKQTYNIDKVKLKKIIKIKQLKRKKKNIFKYIFQEGYQF